MNMKKIYKYILLSILCCNFSCSDVLDTKPLDKYTGETIWSDFNMAEGYIFTLYSKVINNLYTTNVFNEECLTKNARNNKSNSNYVNEKTGLLTQYNDEGWGKWDVIRAINIAIENIENSTFNESQKSILLGECLFLRAATNFYLVKRFGGIQIIKSVLEPTDNLLIARSSLQDSYEYLLDDLKTASNLLPEINDRGRVTKGAAYALIMRVALQGGAYLNDNSYYQKVIQYGNSLFSLEKYSLDDYENLFNSYNSAINSTENILISERLELNNEVSNTPIRILTPGVSNTESMLNKMTIELFPLVQQMDGWCQYSPTQDLVDDYLVTDEDGKEKLWNETSLHEKGKNVYEKMYKNRDLRFYASVAYDSCKYYTNTIFTREYGNVSDESIGGGVRTAGLGKGTDTGYLFAKGVYQDKNLTDIYTSYCYSVLRLGEAYLNYAEASLLLGDEDTARKYITLTYQKHGGFNNSITSSGEELRQAYKRERNVELALEGDRYWSLLRWGMQKSGGLKPDYVSSAFSIPELNGEINGIMIDIEGENYSIVALKETNGLELSFSPRRYLFPIPYSDISANDALIQNSGWDN